MLTFLLGGARSGKSTLAVQMAQRQPLPVGFIATAEPFDDDLRERIDRHRLERPSHWITVECPIELAGAVRAVADDHFLIVDCITIWLANLFAHLIDRSEISRSVVEFNEAMMERRGPTVVVSNEVGMGVHPETALGREYRDELGRTNQLIATTADTTLLLVAGQAIRLEDPWEFLQ